MVMCSSPELLQTQPQDVQDELKNGSFSELDLLYGLWCLWGPCWYLWPMLLSQDILKPKVHVDVHDLGYHWRPTEA